jgi:hypothetical protein
MSQDLTQREPQDDDGFSGSLSSGLFRSNNYLRWTDNHSWFDRDGLKPPSPLLVFAVDEALQKWKDNKQDIIRDKPLPDIEQLNAAIPQSEWEHGLDGNLRKPWEHVVIVCMIDPNTGKSFRYTAATRGAHIAYDDLKEAVITMRALRGDAVIPAVNLSERPFKTNFGMRKRPHYEIVGWKTPGGDAQAVSARPVTPQLAGPAAAPVKTPPAAANVPPPQQVKWHTIFRGYHIGERDGQFFIRFHSNDEVLHVAATERAALDWINETKDRERAVPAVSASPTSNPAQPHQAKPKPAVNLANETLAAMGDVRPATLGEILNDEVPW